MKVTNAYYNRPPTGLPAGVITHGGSCENEPTLKHLREAVLKPVADTVRSLGLGVVEAVSARTVPRIRNGAACGGRLGAR